MRSSSRFFKSLALPLGLALVIISMVAMAFLTHNTSAQIASEQPIITSSDADISQDVVEPVRFIVELKDPALANYQGGIAGLAATDISVTGADRLDVNSAQSQAYLAYLHQAQQTFINELSRAVPAASVATYINEQGLHIEATYQILVNGVAVEVGDADPEVVLKELYQIPGVKAVYLDEKHYPDLYASLDLIGAPAAWDLVGGRAEAGSGVKFATMDQGVHHAAPMFDGTGWDYPPGYPLGDTLNTNGKIIVSRLYVRASDPPIPTDATSWPGAGGGSHGVHTASTAAGNVVDDAMYAGANVGTLSGVAPGAYVMNYRVFYTSMSGAVTFATAEGLAALEDIVRDGADVVNNSWGSGPNSIGAPFNVLDQALVNAANAGVFVAMSNGNAGPFYGTGDHPSDNYINVAASTSGGTYASGRFGVIAPEPVPEPLEGMSFASAAFGAPIVPGTVLTYTMLTAASVDPANVEGCDPWPAGTFDDRAAVISRGACEFGLKVLNAEQAGAEFVVIYNNAGDGLINMGAGAVGAQVTISSIFIGQTNGEALVDWYDLHGDDSVVELNAIAFFVGNDPDVIASFSSRGPSAAGTLKPDIAAPGVNIMAQGYAPGYTGEDVHLNYGQASGTSMAAPHVAGAAAVLRELYPDWSNDAIKSALMSTAKFMEVYNHDGSPAQPLDMGAGRLDLERAVDPGVILSPPSLSYGYIVTGTSDYINVTVTSVAAATETYTTSTIYTGNGFAITQTTALPGFTVMPSEITLAPGESAVITVTFDTAASMGIGDNQGYILLHGDNGHDASMPAWGRVTPAPDDTADILILQNDMSGLLARPNYLSYYTAVLDELGLTYDVYTNLDWWFSSATPTQRAIPDPAILSTYKAIIYFSGNHFQPDGTFAVPTPLTRRDMDRLVEYANTGGTLIVTGQDATDVMGNHFLRRLMLARAALPLTDGIAGFNLPGDPIVPTGAAPPAFDGIRLDLTGAKWVNYPLIGANEVPPVATTAQGLVRLSYRPATGVLNYQVSVDVTQPMTITGAHIHEGGVGVNGPVLYDIFPHSQYTLPHVITDTISWMGSVVLTEDDHNLLMSSQLYINVHSQEYPGGEVRANLGMTSADWSGDGARNQFWVDELPANFTPLFHYPTMVNPAEDGVVAVARRDQPTLENPGIHFLGRLAFLGFGLEGVNNGLPGMTSRAELLDRLLDWAMDEPEAAITPTMDSGNYVVFEADVTSNITGTTGIRYRWDFGDGTPFVGPNSSNMTGHHYEICGVYTVRVEATDSWGNVAIGSTQIQVTEGCTHLLYLPVISSSP
jgi:hypothetical protein